MASDIEEELLGTDSDEEDSPPASRKISFATGNETNLFNSGTTKKGSEFSMATEFIHDVLGKQQRKSKATKSFIS